MRRLLALAAPLLALVSGAQAAIVTLAPVAECQWIFHGRQYPFNPSCPSLDTRQGSRAALLFDLTGTAPAEIQSITLEVVVVQGGFGGSIEAISFGSSPGFPVDPFVTTTLNPTPTSEVGNPNPCFTNPASCPAILLGDYGFQDAGPFPSFDRQPADVTGATGALAGGAFLQLSLIPGCTDLVGCGAQFGHSGFEDPRLAPATLIVRLAARCGDGTPEAPEQCDDGNSIPGDGCSPTCTIEVCGNSFLDPLEECDDGNNEPGDGCSSLCTIEICGNSRIDYGEQCDDGNTGAADGCSPTCQLEICGNETLDPGETCDDGDVVSGDGCDANCTLTGCGNSIVTTGEQCDDGNGAAGDGCDPNCTATGCGNNVLTPPEQCDDGK